MNQDSLYRKTQQTTSELTKRLNEVREDKHRMWHDMSEKFKNDDSLRDRWQMVSDDSVWMFPADIKLSTIEMAPGWKDDFGYQYESCLFTYNDSEVQNRYLTKEKAIEGHRKLAKQYKLKNERMK